MLTDVIIYIQEKDVNENPGNKIKFGTMRNS